MTIAYRSHRQKITFLDFDASKIRQLFSTHSFFSMHREGGLEPGLYRIFDPVNRTAQQRIILAPNLIDNFENICAVFVWGSKHNRYPNFSKNRLVKRKNLILTCGYLTKYIIQKLSVYFDESVIREVSFISNKTKNSYLDGHTLTEIHDGNKWVLMDFSRRCYFTNQNGEKLNGAEIIESQDFNIIDIGSFEFDINHSFKGISTNIAESYFSSQVGLKHFYQHVFGVQILTQNKVKYIYAQEGLSFLNHTKKKIRLSSHEFKQKFYTK